MSYFDVNLNIMTLLKGERKVDEPIHIPEFFKSLQKKTLVQTVEKIEEFLKPFLK
jgi:hypothetical protein